MTRENEAPGSGPVQDSHSFARPSEARVTHLSLSLRIDFAGRAIHGTATIDFVVAEGADTLVLDTRRLAIRSVTDGEGRPLTHELGPEDPLLGAALRVQLAGGARRVAIAYSTTPEAPALDWLEPGQTAGGHHPFLFTHGHAIQTRSWIPIQDSPGIRFTYDASVVVPDPLVAVMSAERLGVRGPEREYMFRMREPIPAYLIALAVGELVSREIGPRTAVFAEPSLLDRAAHEFGELERMVEAAEGLLGPYPWGRFDVLVMPPSFPYGGMENPRLTFASPTILAGDRSLTTVVVHELAHAWAGNLVVNATWNDFWLNEGTTVYVELRIDEVLWGKERSDLLRGFGYRELAATIARMGEAAPDTRLRYDMTGRDPSEGVMIVPYLKGAAFFWTLEAAVGRVRLDAWLRGWFARNAFQSVTTDTLFDDLAAHLLGTGADQHGMDLLRWADEPGLLPEAAPPPSALLARVDDAARALSSGTIPSAIDAKDWSPHAYRHLLGLLLEAGADAGLVAALDAAFHLSSTDNAEILLPWLRLEARVRLDVAAPRIERFLRTHGRYRYVRPLYAELLATEGGAELARRIYCAARARYHHIVRAGLDKLFAESEGSRKVSVHGG